ncbi:MAG: pyridoxine 5'-phosphate synthase [Pseudomonadota bacterium]
MTSEPTRPLRLGVNIDHVATIRNARGGPHPDPVRAAKLAAEAGADGITAHLREDRRHIGDRDIERLSAEIDLPLNLEMAATDEMLAIALRHRPHAACLVPERREEVTTEGGLDAARHHDALAPMIDRLGEAGIRVSLFVDPHPVQLAVAKALGAPVVELHTGTYCAAVHAGDESAAGGALEALRRAALEGERLGLEVHAGHGLDFATVGPVAALPQIAELNIGHFLVGEAIFSGLGAALRRMRALMDEARPHPPGTERP